MLILVQAAITALLSGLVSGFALLGLNERQARAETELKRLEDLFMPYSRWCDKIIRYFQFSWTACDSTYEFYDHNRQASAIEGEIQKAWMELDFLLDVWAPDIAEVVNPVLKNP
jgi:hypothetical protein